MHALLSDVASVVQNRAQETQIPTYLRRSNACECRIILSVSWSADLVTKIEQCCVRQDLWMEGVRPRAPRSAESPSVE